MLLTRAYHEDRGQTRHKVLTPDTAHGTNPATVTMAGLEVVKLETDEAGGVDIDDLRAKADEDVACLMLTNPNTLGLFDPNIEEIAEIVHGVGATLYYDGANLNAVMGLSRPGDMGFDIVHFNLHKSFTQPHGGGGPGSGPIAVSDRIAPFLPVPVVVRREDGASGSSPASESRPTFELDHDRPKSIGRLRGFHGNYGCFVRAYAYIRSLGGDGLKDASETAVLNANYLLARLQKMSDPPVAEHLPLAYGELCMHEFVLSGGPMKRELGIKTLDLAKRLLDYGFHPPTVYFPLLVDEALMVEPTETETKETLDAFAEAIAAILKEAARGSGDRAERAIHDAGPPPGRGRRGQAAGHPAGNGLSPPAMEHRDLGSTGVKVSPLCLGAMMFGAWGNTDHEDSIRIIHRALDAGINFIDTADVYSRGESEEIVGKALAGGRRETVVLATKVHGKMGDEGGRIQISTATRAAGSSRRSRTACGGSAPTGSTCTRSTARSPTPTSMRPSARSATWSATARSATSAARRSPPT